MKKMTDKQRDELKRLRSLERECQRDRKKFFAEIDENLEDVIAHLSERGFVVVPAKDVGKENATDKKKASDIAGAFSSLLADVPEPNDDEEEEPYHFYGDGAE